MKLWSLIQPTVRVRREGHVIARLLPPRVSGSFLCLVMALGQVAQVEASAGGRSGFSGDPSTNAGATCSVCHASDGAANAAMVITGPQTIDAGSTHDFTVTMIGGAAQTAGVGISARDGVGILLPSGADLQQMQGELTHAGPKGISGGLVTFEFRYTAPNFDTAVTLYAAGNSSNGALDLQGDAVTTTSLELTIENGFEDPPPPPNPGVGQVSATLFASGLNRPVAIENAGDERLFVVETAGMIRILEEDGSVAAQPFLDIRDRVEDRGNEMGLLGLAFHPNYAGNGYFYVYYTAAREGTGDRSRVSRFTVTANPNIADPGSEQVLLQFGQPRSNHNGGDIHFGPSGYLHIASGDGGGAGDPENAGQNTTTLLGKMLRIDVDTPPVAGTQPDCDASGNSNYSIPPGNAFNDGSGGAGCDEIFALGLRNPWRFTFDPVTGAMWIADVGQSSREEVNYLPAGGSGGLNLGWRCYEGTATYNTNGCNVEYLPPVYEYARDRGCSITGGRVFRSSSTLLFQGEYFFSDFCQSSIRALSGTPGNLSERVVLPEGELAGVSTFGEDIDRDLYVAELVSGDIYRLDPPPGCMLE